MKKTLIILSALIFAIIFSASSCDNTKSSDRIQAEQQEKLNQEATKQTGMPNVINFRERKLLKSIIELRDQEGLLTYTYLFSEVTGKLTFLGETIGYGIPYATQYTNPEKVQSSSSVGYAILPQADPNGLFSPSSANGTWIMMLDPISKEVRPQYIEPNIITLTFKLSKDDPRLN